MEQAARDACLLEHKMHFISRVQGVVKLRAVPNAAKMWRENNDLKQCFLYDEARRIAALFFYNQTKYHVAIVFLEEAQHKQVFHLDFL